MYLDESAIRFEIIPSGLFARVATPITDPQIDDVPQDLLYRNPYVPDDVYQLGTIVDQSAREDIATILDDPAGAGLHKLDRADLDSYGQALVDIGLDTAFGQADIVLCPLRGSIKPALQLKLMTRLGAMEVIPYTRGSSGEFDQAILEDLRRKVPEHSRLRIAVLDVADGGYGSRHLVNLLKVLYDERRPDSWDIVFYLLHQNPKTLGRVIGITGMSEVGFKLDVKTHWVPDLLVEDWDAALGISVTIEGRDYDIKACDRSGRVLVCEPQSVYLVQSPDLSATVDKLIAQSVSDAIRSHPQLKYLRNDAIFARVHERDLGQE